MKKEQFGDYLPRLVNYVFERQGFFTQINYTTAIEAWKYSATTHDSNEIEFTYNAPTAVYSPIQMMPQAIGIFLSRHIGLDVYTQGMFGRLGNLIFFIVLGYFSIKIIPYRKNFLLLFLLSPKIMYLSATMSGDIFTNSIIIFYISYILKLKYENKTLTKKKLMIPLLLAPFVAICKTIYLPVCFLVGILPTNCFKNNKRRIAYIISVIIISIATSLAWIKLSNSISFSSDLDTLPSQQIKYVKENPIEFIGVLIRGVCNNSINWSEDIVGGYMEWGSAFSQPEIISIIVYVLFAISILLDKENEKKIKLKVNEIVLISLICLIVIAGALSAMYINWTPLYAGVGGLEIVGVQGRYFVPIVLLISLLMPCKIFKLDESFNANKIKWIYIFMCLCEFYSISNIFVRNI